ncbi:MULTISPECIES: RNA-binding protein [Methanobrevibacter]|uniref:RNA-binding protein n=1 Tax=Methanobrevibacter TaxID=2172 RepID=UPI0015B99343|nr:MULTISPECIES: RNA-binding protein [Methanobrevibacter]MBS7257001.1 RNA-binding protein [Methanobrevibacter sp.]MCI7428086.1 RNA-binding protein [Methanobrevibacter sp.]MDD6777227.1 RNA-binding protein [Methanobacteriaceae archaeon]MDY3096700.1 RNA-binding protein [Methanobrevibacter sp.]
MIHNIKFRAFVYKNESVDEISQAILNLLPEAEIEAEEAEGLLEDKILILTGVVSKKRYTKDFFNKLLQSTDLEKLNNDLEQKMDEKGNWFLRFDKNDALDEKLTVLDKGDSIHLKVKIAAFPAKKQIAVDKVREAIDSFKN